MPRNRRELEQAREQAGTREERALACFRLGVFHDNNGREVEAIPLYGRALHPGLDPRTHAHALTYLASSLYKTGRLEEALSIAEEAASSTDEAELVDFLIGLRRRIRRRLPNRPS